MDRRTIVVAGANGMLGSALVERLLGLDFHVVALYRVGHRVRRVRPALSANFHPVEVPVIEAAVLQQALVGITADTLVNCIGAGVDPAERDSESLWLGNVKPVTELMAFAAATGIARVIHSGSEAEYARAVVGLRISEDHPILPFTEYGAAKAASVYYAAAFAQALAIKLLVLRPFYIFGPGERAHRLLPTIAAAAASGRPALMTQGEQSRDFLYVDDAADAYAAAVNIRWPGDVTVCNLCSGEARKVRGFVELAARMFGLSSDLLKWGAIPDRETDAPWIVGDPSRIKAILGWRATLTLEQGIERWIRAEQTRDTSPVATLERPASRR
jgi:nucleoside-diphosphate-sugar epimerase